MAARVAGVVELVAGVRAPGQGEGLHDDLALLRDGCVGQQRLQTVLYQQLLECLQ